MMRSRKIAVLAGAVAIAGGIGGGAAFAAGGDGAVTTARSAPAGFYACVAAGNKVTNAYPSGDWHQRDGSDYCPTGSTLYTFPSNESMKTAIDAAIATVPKGDPGKDGVNGQDGATGPAGPAGPAGAPGKDGVDGTNGIDGKDGATGPQGPAGAPGPVGATGPAGKDGADGVSGYEVVGRTADASSATGEQTLTTACPAGDTAIGGGLKGGATVTVHSSYPSGTTEVPGSEVPGNEAGTWYSTSWTVAYANSAASKVQPYVICMTAPTQ